MKTLKQLHNPVVRGLIAVVLAVTGLAPWAGAPRAARADGPYVVDTLADLPDVANDGLCADAFDNCSLRAAIQEAFDDPVPTTITFDAFPAGSTLFLDDTYGTILWNGDNITVTGSADIKLSGLNLTGSQAIIQIGGSHNVLRRLWIQDGPANGLEVGDFAGVDAGSSNFIHDLRVTGNVGAGIYVRGGGGSGGQANVFIDNKIGLSDVFALGCVAGEGNGNGVVVGLSAIRTQVNANTIGCNAYDGVVINGTGGTPVDTYLNANRVGSNLADAAVGNGLAGVSVLAGARGVTVDGNIISGNAEQGVFVAGAATGLVTVTQNMIGASAGSVFALANGLEGILVTGAASADMLIDNNTIAGNDGSGIGIAGSAYVTVTRNRIGIVLPGITAMPNGGDGVKLSSGANHNLIGGTQASGLNVISGNLGSGVLIDGATTTLNQISGNYIGTNAAGTGAVANLGSGVRFDHGAHHNLLGSSSLNTQRNVISGNGQDGVYIVRLAHDNTVDGNFIGLNAAGTAGIGNSVAGVAIIESPSNVIGSLGATTSQYISGNAYHGIYVSGSNFTYIGTNLIGVSFNPSAPLGNGWQGIMLNEATNTRVEVTAVAYNGRAGVAVTGNLAAGNKIFAYENHSNGGLPIDLNDDGATTNDAGDADLGPNTLLNYPVITAVAGATVTGTACFNCAVFVYKAIGNPAAPGGGGLLLDGTTADGAGDWSLSGLPPGLTLLDLSASACDTVCGGVPGNTSEMSPRWQLSLPIVVR